MTISEQFCNEPRFSRLSRRKENFEKMCVHASETYNSDGVIIETGTAWDQDNWEGQGQSTLIWDWLASKSGVEVYSIDLSKEHIETAKKQTKYVHYLTGNSIEVLNQIPKALLERCKLLYLDSFDWSQDLNLESAYHHMAELTSVWSSLPVGCMVVVDDRHGDHIGKHWMVEAFMTVLSIKPVFKNHQIAWIKT